MTWEETIIHIRAQPEYKDLVIQAYIHEDIRKNVENYMASQEFAEILILFHQYAPHANQILDIGCGNGITSIAFAIQGYTVDAVEPDPSSTVGAEAIRRAAKIFDINDKITVHQSFAETISFPDQCFDIVFARQAMHHAQDLNSFVNEMARTLKPGGLFLTVRDHVIFDEADKRLFLQTHPLQKFYGGENAFTPDAYRAAIKKSGLQLIREIRFFDNVINYFPLTPDDLSGKSRDATLQRELQEKLGVIGSLRSILKIYKLIRNISVPSEKDFPGRMYSYIATK